MGLLDDYGVDVDDIPASAGISNPEDGIYEFQVDSFKLVEGSTAHPDWDFLVLTMTITNEDGKARSFAQWYHLPEDPARIKEAEKNTLSRMKKMLLDLGVAESQINSVEEEDLVGITGTFKLVSRKTNQGNVFQNINDLKVDEDAPAPKAPEPVKKPRATRKPRAAAPVEEPTPDTEVSLPQQELAAVEEEPAPVQDEGDSDAAIKAKIAERRAARANRTAASGQQPNPFAPQG